MFHFIDDISRQETYKRKSVLIFGSHYFYFFLVPLPETLLLLPLLLCRLTLLQDHVSRFLFSHLNLKKLWFSGKLSFQLYCYCIAVLFKHLIRVKNSLFYCSQCFHFDQRIYFARAFFELERINQLATASLLEGFKIEQQLHACSGLFMPVLISPLLACFHVSRFRTRSCNVLCK